LALQVSRLLVSLEPRNPAGGGDLAAKPFSHVLLFPEYRLWEQHWGYSENSEFANESLDATNGTITCLHAKGIDPGACGRGIYWYGRGFLVSVTLPIGFALFI
jgi:hypothetical protein